MPLSWADDAELQEEVKRLDGWQLILHLSKNRDTDKFNDRGINVSAQQRRQGLEPWYLVDRSNVRAEEDDEFD